MNGKHIGEIGMSSAITGYHGIPCVFVSGDRAAADEAKELIPDIEVAIVKEALSAEVTGLSQAPVASLSSEKAREVIREVANRAMSKVDRLKLLRFEAPYTLRWRFA